MHVAKQPGLATWRADDFGQTVHEVVALGAEAEVLRQVDDAHSVGHMVFCQELPALSMAEAEEENVHLAQRHCVCEAQLRVAVKPLVNVGHGVAGVALAVGKYDFRLWRGLE